MNKTILQQQLMEFFRDLTSLGGLAAYILITLLYIKSLIFIGLLFGFFFTAAIVIVIRLFYFKDRPKKEGYANLIERIAASAFPSLHAARIVFLAMLFSAHYNSNYLTGAFTVTAIAASYSRIYLQKHDYADVIGGVILGGVTFMIASYWF
mgnify:FL=1